MFLGGDVKYFDETTKKKSWLLAGELKILKIKINVMLVMPCPQTFSPQTP